MGKVMIFDHPLIQHKVSLMRDKNTASKNIENMLDMVYLVCSDLRLPLPNRKLEAA